METAIKLNFTMINLIFNVVANVTCKWKENIVLHLLLSRFFSIYLGWVSCFYFFKIRFFITGNAPLILIIFNNITAIILFLIRNLLFLSNALLFTVSLLIFLNYICHLNYPLLFYFFYFHVNHGW